MNTRERYDELADEFVDEIECEICNEWVETELLASHKCLTPFWKGGAK